MLNRKEFVRIEEYIERLLLEYVNGLRRLARSLNSLELIVKLVLASYDYVSTPHYAQHLTTILKDIRSILQSIPPCIPDAYADHVREKIYHVVETYRTSIMLLVDNLSIVELGYIATRPSVTFKAIHIVINPSGSTRVFKELVGVDKLSELARVLGAHFEPLPDKFVHSELENPMNIRDLVSKLRKTFQLHREYNFLVQRKDTSTCRPWLRYY